MLAPHGSAGASSLKAAASALPGGTLTDCCAVMDEGSLPSFPGRFACAALMSAGGASCINLCSSVSFMHYQCSCSKWHSFCLGLCGCITACCALKLPVPFIYRKWAASRVLNSQVSAPPTCAIILASAEIQLVSRSSKSPCVRVPAVSVILLSDNRAVSQNRGGGRGMGTLSPGCELNDF